ncbi:MAG: ATP-binding domain-containing protein [Actinomycetota bacterium]
MFDPDATASEAEVNARSSNNLADVGDPYPFEGEDGDEITELNLEDLDRFGRDDRITVGELVGEVESWRFGHVIVDEAQDLTPMQWRMVMRRARGQSLTIVGDLAQRSAGPAGTWRDHLPPELAEIERLDLSINYRSPAEIHSLAVAVLAEFAPDVEASRPLRSSGFAPEFRHVDELSDATHAAVSDLRDRVSGQIAVIRPTEELGDREPQSEDEIVRTLHASEAKGLEFDAVVLVEPAAILAEVGGAALLYIALTRATQRLVILHRMPLPEVLRLHP